MQLPPLKALTGLTETVTYDNVRASAIAAAVRSGSSVAASAIGNFGAGNMLSRRVSQNLDLSTSSYTGHNTVLRVGVDNDNAISIDASRSRASLRRAYFVDDMALLMQKKIWDGSVNVAANVNPTAGRAAIRDEYPTRIDAFALDKAIAHARRARAGDSSDTYSGNGDNGSETVCGPAPIFESLTASFPQPVLFDPVGYSILRPRGYEWVPAVLVQRLKSHNEKVNNLIDNTSNATTVQNTASAASTMTLTSPLCAHPESLCEQPIYGRRHLAVVADRGSAATSIRDGHLDIGLTRIFFSDDSLGMNEALGSEDQAVHLSQIIAWGVQEASTSVLQVSNEGSESHEILDAARLESVRAHSEGLAAAMTVERGEVEGGRASVQVMLVDRKDGGNGGYGDANAGDQIKWFDLGQCRVASVGKGYPYFKADILSKNTPLTANAAVGNLPSTVTPYEIVTDISGTGLSSIYSRYSQLQHVVSQSNVITSTAISVSHSFPASYPSYLHLWNQLPLSHSLPLPIIGTGLLGVGIIGINGNPNGVVQEPGVKPGDVAGVSYGIVPHNNAMFNMVRIDGSSLFCSLFSYPHLSQLSRLHIISLYHLISHILRSHRVASPPIARAPSTRAEAISSSMHSLSSTSIVFTSCIPSIPSIRTLKTLRLLLISIPVRVPRSRYLSLLEKRHLAWPLWVIAE